MAKRLMASTDVAVALENLKMATEHNASKLREQGDKLDTLAAMAMKQVEMSQQMIALSERQSEYQARNDRKVEEIRRDVRANTKVSYMWLGAGTALSVASIAIAIYANLGRILGS